MLFDVLPDRLFLAMQHPADQTSGAARRDWRFLGVVVVLLLIPIGILVGVGVYEQRRVSAERDAQIRQFLDRSNEIQRQKEFERKLDRQLEDAIRSGR